LSDGTVARPGGAGDRGAAARAVVPQTHGLHVGPAQQRYGDYFADVLYAPAGAARSQQAVVLSQVVFNGFELLNTAAAAPAGEAWLDDERPFQVVFQAGRRAWAGFPETLVRRLLRGQGGTL